MKFLDTPAIIEQTKSIIENAKSYVHIFSPYLQISEEMEKLLLNADKAYKPINIKIVCKMESLLQKEYKKIKRIALNSNNIVTLYFNPFFHAKIVESEEYALVSSMNLYKASEKNFEAGIYFSHGSKDERQAFNKLQAFCNEILNSEYTVDYDEELELSGCVCFKKYFLSYENNQWLRDRAAELQKTKDELANDIIKSYYKSIEIEVNGLPRTCENGLKQGFINAVMHNDALHAEINELRKRLAKYERID